MSTFITNADYKVAIRDQRLQQLIDQDNSILDDAEAAAIAIVQDALYARYDTATIFTATGQNRKMQVVRWVRGIAMYYLHERLPDKMMPPNIEKEYNRILDTLTEIERGNKSTDLPPISISDPNGDGNTNATRFRWGSNKPRSQH